MHFSNTSRATIDFESRSLCSLRKCGSWRYSLDPSTEVLCLAYHLPFWDEDRTGLWHPGFQHLGIEEGENFNDLYDLFMWLKAGELVEAHNAWFERGIWVNIMVPRWGWQPIRHEQWRCSAAKAAAHALPRKLDDVGEALDLEEEDLKDTEGASVMKKTMQPRKALKEDIRAWGVLHAGCSYCGGTGKTEGINPDTGRQKKISCLTCQGKGYRGPIPEMPILWHESREVYEQLWAYCRQDVIAEKAVSNRLIDLDENETKMFLMDAAVNERGFQLDVEGVNAALEVVEAECADLNIELHALTGGTVEKATQRDRMKEWFAAQGLLLENTQKETIDAILSGTSGHPSHQIISSSVRRGLELVKTLGRSSVSKYVKMRDWVCPDGRVRGGLLYHGASTGRWSGQGVQPHNFVKGSIKDMEGAWNAIKSRDRTRIATFTNEQGEPYADVMEVLSYALRGAIIPSPGHQFYVADYAAIEARVLLWLAKDMEALDIFREGRDIYCDFAPSIYGHTITKTSHPEKRAVCKVAILGLGYQMGVEKFVATCLAMAGVTISEDMARIVVEAYRSKYWRVKQMWWDQEAAAIKAVKTRRPIQCGYVIWLLDDGFLRCELPSGRWLSYPNPEIRQKYTPWGELKDTLTYEGMNAYTRQWCRQHSYGGMLVENITQAIARDIMAEAMLRCEVSDIYKPILSVHDELIAEAVIGAGSVLAFETLVAEVPSWAEGCPIAAEGWAGLRYRK